MTESEQRRRLAAECDGELIHAGELLKVTQRELLAARKDGGAGDVVVQLRLADDSIYSEKGKIDFIDVAVDPTTGATTSRWSDHDEAWAEIVPGAPAFLADGTLVVCADRDGARRLMVDDVAVTPVELQVRSVVSIVGEHVWFIANPIDDALVAETAKRIADIRASAEGREGVASFLEKRKPAWVKDFEAVRVKPKKKRK